ncbi:MAG: tRNA pseudouridine(55) synthase TruB [Burkholderiaceae bacterium]|nr:tRNA pseudouridine(55) synthase TruB [Burkholderiaceae bacterium]
MNTQSPRRAQVDGVLLLDKPRGLTSNDALMRARRLLNARKAGHGGTLDPMASGLLPVAFGEATKFASHALDADKCYLAQLCFGLRTATGDAEGEVIERRPVSLDEARLRAVLREFTGPIDQVPPMHSALKRNGKPLYAYAREGVELERAARRVRIHRLELTSLDPCGGVEPGQPGSMRARVRVTCSKGTYVRTLAEDIGETLGCGAYLSELRRERVGGLCVDDALTLEQLEAIEPDARRARLAPTDFLVSNLPLVRIAPEQAERILQGQRLRLDPLSAPANGSPDAAGVLVRVYCGDRLLGLATLSDGLLVAQRLVSAIADADVGATPPTSTDEPIQ